MASNPAPDQSVRDFDRECTIVKTNSDRTIFSNAFEVEEEIAGVRFQEFQTAVGLLLDIWRKLPV
jgi:hypothetical protein